MSVPPQGPPPGGYYYTPPPPPNQGNSNGCLKAAGITCGVLLLLGILGTAALFFVGKRAYDHPDRHSPMGFVAATTKTALNAAVIREAVVKYHTKTGHYPANLASLVPEYLPNASTLHSPLDSIESEDHVSWQYIKPKEGGNPHTPLLRMRYDIDINGSTQRNGPQKGEIVMNLDGTTETSPHGYSNSNGSYSTRSGGMSGGSGYPQPGQ